MSSTTNWQEKFTSFLKGRGKIQQLAELTAVQQMQAIAKDNLKNMEAESAEVRRSLWGGGKNNEEETDDMATTILGDVTHPTPIVINQPPQQSNPFLPIAAAGLLGLLGAGTGAAATAYLLSQKAQPVAPEFDDETLTIGLGRIENFTKASETQ
jgi:hypothetical protein